MDSFKTLRIDKWRQFSNIEIDFHSQLTVIAGANGAGKSTLLRILSQHFGVPNRLLGTPRVSKSGIRQYLTGLFFPERAAATGNSVGALTYTDGHTTNIAIPTDDSSAAYTVNFVDMRSVEGLFINSHRPHTMYQPVGSIPTNGITAEQAYQTYQNEIIQRFNNSHIQFGSTYRIKEAIISMATFGLGNANVQKNEILEKTYLDFKAVLRAVLPKTIGFRDISIRIPDVVLVTDSGDFMIDAASGGLTALIDIAWQIFLYSRGRDSFTVIIDEPENHLHPSMQRVLIENLINAFPKARFILATHSPFIVSSVKDSAVYVLHYGADLSDHGVNQTVRSEKLDNINKAGDASDILRRVLGVPVTLPLWAEADIESISAEFDLNSLDRDSINTLRRRLEGVGLGNYYSEALARLAGRDRQ